MNRDAEKTRDWQRRSAERAHARAQERARVRAEAGERTTLAPVSKRKLEREAAAGPKRSRRSRSTLRDGAGFAASPAQRAKVAGMASIHSGQGPCDPAHLWPRGRGGCDSPLCVVPLTRAEHDAFDRGGLDILGDLINHGCWDELAHMALVHQVDPLSMLHRLTGERHLPESEMRREAERLARRMVEEVSR